MRIYEFLKTTGTEFSALSSKLHVINPLASWHTLYMICWQSFPSKTLIPFLSTISVLTYCFSAMRFCRSSSNLFSNTFKDSTRHEFSFESCWFFCAQFPHFLYLEFIFLGKEIFTLQDLSFLKFLGMSFFCMSYFTKSIDYSCQ